jgi:acyl-CoA synthetase (AMP-forming)/AMP-acid ligase II
MPKGVEITHRSVAGSLRSAPLDRASTLMHAAPIATFMATHGIQALVVQFALTELVLPAFDAPRFAALLAAERPEWLTMVPAHALLLLESGALDGVDTSATSVVMFGGAPMPHDAIKGLSAAFPNAGLVNGYGLTESGTTVVAMPPGEALRRPGAVGKPFDPGAVRIVDEEGGDVDTGAVGEVAIRVPPGERRYHNDAEATAAAWRGEWLHTGDLGFLDPDGYLHLVDRKKDVIVRGGYNISSLEVEGALHEHPDVVEAAVVGIEHRVLGQDVAAVLRLRRGADPERLDLDAFLADRLTDYKRPRTVVVSEEPLPRTAMGKLDKRALREQLASG